VTSTRNGLSPAVFLDRDGTVIEHVHHLHRVEDVHLIPNAAEAIALLRARGYLCVIVTNQSVVGRGLTTESELGLIHQRMHDQLAAEGTSVDGLYYCTLVPGTGDQTVVEDQDRKPGPGMLLRAARELGIDLGRSWMVGDSLSDIEAGKNAGCRESILVLTGFGAKVLLEGAHSGRHGPDLWAVAQMIVADGSEGSRSL